MTTEELIKIGSKTIRKDPKLMSLYIEKYVGFFGKKPNCVGCSFSSDFNKLRKKVLTLQEPKKIIKMSDKKEYVLKKKHRSEILSYTNKKKRVVRRYGRDINDEFAKELIKSNKKYKDYFESLPEPKAKPKQKAKKEEEAKETKEDK